MGDHSEDGSRRWHFHLAVSERRGGIIVAGALAAAGALFAWQSSRLDLGNLELPGPGFFPLFLGAVLVAFAAVIGFDCWRSPPGEAVELGHRDVLIAIAALLVVPLLFEPLGAYITLGLFGTVMLVLIARIRLLPAIAAAGVGMAACWFFFQQLLGLQLPAWPW
jgi:putative tricarboxylic transport membrane protein